MLRNTSVSMDLLLGQPASSSLKLQALVSKLLARAVGSCLAGEDAQTAHTVVLEMQQVPQQPGLLVLRGVAAATAASSIPDRA